MAELIVRLAHNCAREFVAEDVGARGCGVLVE